MQWSLAPKEAEIPLELQVLAACCDHPYDADTVSRVEALASRIDNWDAFDLASRRHNLQGFVHDRLRDFPALPEHLKSRWSAEAKRRALYNLAQARATGRIHGVLNDGGISNLVLKGLPLAITLYSSLTMKRSTDIDLLVSPQDAWRAIERLADAGFVEYSSGTILTRRQFEAVQRHFKEITLKNRENIVVDLHWKLVGSRDLLKGIKPFQNARSVEVENIGDIAALGEGDEFVYLCAHGALSDWSRLKWLCDVNAILNSKSPDEIAALHEHADSIGAGVCVLQALGLRERLWGRSMPLPLRKRLDALARPQLFAYPIERMVEPYRPASSLETLKRIARQAQMRSILYEDRSLAASELRSHLRALPDVLAAPLPRRLDWLYVPMRPLMWAGRKLRL